MLYFLLLQLNKAGSATMTTSTTAPLLSAVASLGGITPAPGAQTAPSQTNQVVMPVPGVVPPNMIGMMPGMIPGMPAIGTPNVGALANYEAIKRAHELAMRLGFHQIPFGMPLMPTMMPTNFAEDGGSKSVKAPVLRLDAQGREIDEHGNVVERSKVTNVSTLKVQCFSRIFLAIAVVLLVNLTTLLVKLLDNLTASGDVIDFKALEFLIEACWPLSGFVLDLKVQSSFVGFEGSDRCCFQMHSF